MQKQENLKPKDNDIAGTDVSMADLLVPLWRSRKLVLLITSTVTICILTGTIYLAEYRSEGFFQFGGAIPAVKEKDKEKALGTGISLADYKRYSASYVTKERFAEFAQVKKLDSTAGVDKLKKVFASRDGIAKLIEPVYPFTKLDAKELMDQPKDNSNNVIGLHITFLGDTPEEAEDVVDILGHYVLDSIVYVIYSDELRYKHSEIMAKMTKLDNVIITNKELLEQYRRKGADLKQIVARYPETGGQGIRQVVSITEDNARYLSPVTQLATTEVQASEAREAIFKAKRELAQSVLWLDYYDRLKVLLDSTKSGEAILLGLEPVKENVFKGKNMEDDAVKEVFNTITIDNRNAINLYLEKSRFIAGPTLPTRSTVRPLLVSVVSLLLGLFFSISFVYTRNWWHDNWRKITAQ